MYHAQSGDQTFNGAFGRLLAEEIRDLLNGLEDLPDYETEHEAFDNLLYNQKIWVINQTTRALLCEDYPMPELYAYNEAFVGLLFAEIRGNIDFEMDSYSPKEYPDDYNFWRKLVIAAAKEQDIYDDDDMPTADCDDSDEWDIMVETLSEIILWDRDFEMTDLFLDVEPDLSDYRSRFLTINKEYFTAIPEDPSDEQTEQIFDDLREFLNGYLNNDTVNE